LTSHRQPSPPATETTLGDHQDPRQASRANPPSARSGDGVGGLRWSEEVEGQPRSSRIHEPPVHSATIPSLELGQQQPHLTASGPPHEHEAEEGFFGPTSELHVSSPSEYLSRSQVPDRHNPAISIDMDSPGLQSSLLRSYWNYQTLSVVVVDAETFLSQRASKSRSQFYSKFLENTILACSARLSTSFAVRALGEEYAKRAKSELITELDGATMATLQGLLLLSDYEMTSARDRVGWIYCGIDYLSFLRGVLTISHTARHCIPPCI